MPPILSIPWADWSTCVANAPTWAPCPPRRRARRRIGASISKAQFNDDWDWEAGFGVSSENTDSDRLNTLDNSVLQLGLNSNGLPGSQFLFGETAESCAEKGGAFSFGFCRVPTPPIPPISPWGDLTPYIIPSLLAASTNGQTRFDALVRGGLWTMPAGEVRVLLGYSRHATSLDSESEFTIGIVDESPISDVASFNTEAQRSNQALYTEALVPLAEDRLSLSLSARWGLVRHAGGDLQGDRPGDGVHAGYRRPGRRDDLGRGAHIHTRGRLSRPPERADRLCRAATQPVAPDNERTRRATISGGSSSRNPMEGLRLRRPSFWMAAIRT